MLFPNLSIMTITEEVEMCLAKVRMNRAHTDRENETRRVQEEMGESVDPDPRRHPLDLTLGTYDLSIVRPTDMRNNKCIIMPDAKPEPEELLLAARRNVWLRTAKAYLDQNCDEKG